MGVLGTLGRADGILGYRSCTILEQAENNNKAKYEHSTATTKTSANTGPEVIPKISCSTQLSIKFFLLINVKMPTNVGILSFMSRKNSILALSEPDKS